MYRINYFFERHEFIDVEIPGIVVNNSEKTQQKSAKTQHIPKPYYKYLGYFRENPVYKYPVSLYFGKDEIAIDYVKEDGKILKVFSLYVAEGELNQNILGKKIEDYAFMPLWQLPNKLPEEKCEEIFVNPVLLKTGFFASYYGFKFEENCFEENNLLDIYAQKARIENDTKLIFRYGKSEDNQLVDKWEIEDGKDVKIKVSKINFVKILLDFLFELDFANTFEDENFFRLQPHIQNNLVLDALTKKCQYIAELDKQRNFSRKRRNSELPKPFLDAEKEWLNVCFLESYRDVFASRNSIFRAPEEEAELVLFKTRIGASSRDRSELFTRNDVNLRNRSATFFLRNYSIYSAFRTLLHPAAIYSLPFLLLLIPFGDFCLNLLDDPLKQFVGVSSIGIPIMMLAVLIVHYAFTRINLFKLLVPRLFLGIMIGWSIFWSTEALWKSTVIAEAGKIVVVNSAFFVLIYLYVFTDIRNKLVRVRESAVLKRATVLVLFAMLISFVQGFYVLQFQAKPMLENSGFLTSDNPKLFDKKNVSEIKDIKITGAIAKITHKVTGSSEDHEIIILGSGRQGEKTLFGIKNFSIAELFTGTKFYYIWSIHLSQFMVSILIGIVLQLLWEDRPITEPL